MSEPRLDKYSVYLKLTVLGESPDDAIEYASNAIDSSDLLTQDGVVGIELIDDADSIELLDDEDGYGYGNDEDEDSEDY